MSDSDLVQQVGEHHPMMEKMVIASGIAGVGLGIGGLVAAGDNPGPGLLLIAIGVSLVWGAVHIWRVSDGFARWSQLSPGDQLLGSLIMLPGALAAFTVLLVPILVISAARRA